MNFNSFLGSAWASFLTYAKAIAPMLVLGVAGAHWVSGVGCWVCKYRPRLWQSVGWAWHPPIIFEEVTWKLELDFYFRFVKTVRHFRNGAKVVVLPHGVRGGVPSRGSPLLKVRLLMEKDFLK